MSRNGETVRLESRTLRLLLHLVKRRGEVVSLDECLDEVWPDVTVGLDSVYQAVASLRRALGDASKQPRYIATVARRGYRLVAPVSEIGEPTPPTAVLKRDFRPALRFFETLSIALTVVIATAFSMLLLSPAAAPSPKARGNSIAVLPFLDLTSAAMSNVADGVTEELIDRLSELRGVRVPSPTASFYFKGRRATVGEVARALNVPLLLDGSLRMSGSTLRIAVRLVGGNNGYVLWSKTYDRPAGDILKVEDEIAADVVRALGPCLERHARDLPA